MQYLLNQEEFEEYQRLKKSGAADVKAKFVEMRKTMQAAAIEVQRRYGHLDLHPGDTARRVFEPVAAKVNELEDLLTKPN
jgi:hypothetical protein